MPLVYRIAADLVVVIHVAYASFVVLALAFVIAGGILRWNWIRNPWFRVIHLAMITVVVLESWFGITCPLTTWEQSLRRQAGVASYSGDFLANALHELLFVSPEPWVLTVCYTLFGLTVAGSLLLIPPRWSGFLPVLSKESVEISEPPPFIRLSERG